MQEQEHYHAARIAAEAMANLWELEAQQCDVDLDQMMGRLKDLSAYSLTHAEIMDQREGVELLALAMFFGATSDPAFHGNQRRLSHLSERACAYPGSAEVIEQQVAQRKAKQPQCEARQTRPGTSATQPRLL